MTRAQINLKDEAAYKELQRLAARLGYYQVGGQAHGEGSIRQMLLAVARGELIVSTATNTATPGASTVDSGETRRGDTASE